MLKQPPVLRKAFIGGQWTTTGRTFPVTNPATGEVIAEVADCGAAEACAAADGAVAAFATWKQTTAYERAAILKSWASLMIRDESAIGRLMSQEMGKPIRESRGEVRYAAAFCEWFAEEAKRIYGETIPSQFPHKRLLVLRQPVGPAFGITPWNFPAAMVTRKAAPALAAGCTFILKPAEQSPLTALRFAELWEEAGGPPGTLQVAPALDPVPFSDVLIADERIRKLTFTGSTVVGRLLYQSAARTLKRVSLELGGHAPFIVFADADLPAAAREAIACKFRNTGQTCVCTNRIYVHAAIKEEFTRLYLEETRKLNVGDPLAEETQIGPLVDRQALAKVEEHVRDAVAKGAKVLTGGRANGQYYEPTVLVDVAPGMRLMEEETFGPVAPILTFQTDEEAVRLANDTPYGLAAYFWTRDAGRIFRVAEALEYGIVGVNDGVPATVQAPFGGVKASGLGREGGREGIEEYLDTRYVSVTLPA